MTARAELLRGRQTEAETLLRRWRLDAAVAGSARAGGGASTAGGAQDLRPLDKEGRSLATDVGAGGGRARAPSDGGGWSSRSPDRGGRRISSAGDGDLERWVQSHLAIAGVLTAPHETVQRRRVTTVVEAAGMETGGGGAAATQRGLPRTWEVADERGLRQGSHGGSRWAGLASGRSGRMSGGGGRLTGAGRAPLAMPSLVVVLVASSPTRIDWQSKVYFTCVSRISIHGEANPRQ
ncbi:uncharacterized protein [Lolium perenne]|uniref:uncharacterized protein n=1 Tax=Lolium perenne TaxID=4522 RepID=UPI003A99F798